MTDQTSANEAAQIPASRERLAASSGIGQAFAHRLRAEGYNLGCD